MAKKETKNEKTKRIANKKVLVAIKALDVIKGMPYAGRYELDPHSAQKLIDAIEIATEATLASLQSVIDGTNKQNTAKKGYEDIL